jgi:hypothetical protein
MVDMPIKSTYIVPRPIDFRINRIVVMIMKSKALYDYFFDLPKISLARRYLGIEEHYIGTAQDLALFLDGLYFIDPEKFRQFLEFVLTEIVDERKPLLVTNGKEIFDGFGKFLSELNTLGFDYDFSSNKVILTVGHMREDRQIKTELEEMLERLDSKYCPMLNGAWESFLSDNPDKYRQTITSLREMTSMVIRQLAPNEETRKDKIKKIIGSEKETALVESLAETIVKLQDVQSTKVHTEPDYDSTLFALKATENLLFFLLKKVVAIEG